MTERALFLTPIYDPYAGGAARHFQQLVEGLTDTATVETAVVVSASAADTQVYERTETAHVFRVLFSPNSIKTGFSKPKLAANYLLATLVSMLVILLFRISIVHTHTRGYFVPTVRLARSLSLRVVVDGRDLGAPEFAATGDVFVCVSEKVAELAADRAERTVHIPVGADFEKLAVTCRETETPAEPYILFVGDVTARKGVPELLTAVSDGSINRDLIMIGEHIDSEIDPECVDGVQYLGPQPHEVALCHIREADVVVLPSKEEAFGRVVLEAVFHETPAVCPPGVPEHRRYLPETTLSAVEPDEITAKIEYCLSESVDLGEFPLSEHRVSNVIDRYAALYDPDRSLGDE